MSFSPVAGIQWVETRVIGCEQKSGSCVSVPLPGFSGLRLQDKVLTDLFNSASFSPVAGIQWVETLGGTHADSVF